jgi:hypothetical protein
LHGVEPTSKFLTFHHLKVAQLFDVSINYSLNKILDSSATEVKDCGLDVRDSVLVRDTGFHPKRPLRPNHRSTPSFGFEAKPEVPCRKILRHIKSLASVNETLARQNCHVVHSSYLLPEDSAGSIVKEHWWTCHEFSLPASSHHGSPYSDITCGMNNRPVVGRSSEM